MTDINVPKCLTKISPRWSKILEEYSIEEILESMFTKDKTWAIDNDEWEADREARATGIPVLNLQQFDCCIVGEAYGCHNLKDSGEHGTDEYGCRVCYTFSMSFLTQLEGMNVDHQLDDCDVDCAVSDYNEEDYESMIEDFCGHIKEKHPELIKESGEECKHE